MNEKNEKGRGSPFQGPLLFSCYPHPERTCPNLGPHASHLNARPSVWQSSGTIPTPAVSQLGHGFSPLLPPPPTSGTAMSPHPTPRLSPETRGHHPALGWLPTHAALHQHEATLVAVETLALEAAWGVDTGALATEVRGDAALVDVCGDSGRGPGLHVCRHSRPQGSPKAPNRAREMEVL